MRIQLSILALLVLLLTAVLLPASAQTAPTAAPNPIPINQIGGVTSAIAYDNGNLFFNVGPRLVRLAVSSSTALTPTLPGTYGPILPGVPVNIKAANGYLYVALGKGGVAVVDETSLQVLSVQTLPGTASAGAVAVAFQQLYVAAGTTGVIGYNIGPDQTLTYQQTRSFTSPVRDVTDVAVRSIGGGEYLFVTANNFATLPADSGGVLKFDITGDPNLGAPAKSIQLDANSLVVTDTFALVGGDGSLYALDTANLGTAGEVSTTLLLGSRALKVALRPNAPTAYVIDDFGMVNVVSIGAGSPPALAVIGSFFTNDVVKDIAAVEYAGNVNTYLYLADSGSGLSLASATQVAPQTVTPGSLSYVQPKPGVTSVVAVAYPQVFGFSLPSTLWTIDAANFSSLSAVGSGQAAQGSSINALTPYAGSLLASDGVDGVARYQLSPGSEPVLTDTLATGGTAYDAAVVWPLAAVANGDSGLAVLDLSDPITMTLTGSAPSPSLGAFTHVAAQGVFAYVADDGGVIPEDAALRIYDLTDPTVPVARGMVTQTGILDVKVSGQFAFMAVGAGGVRIADITNPDAPTIIATDDYTGTILARSLVVYKNFLFVTGGDSGVQMLAFDPVTGLLSLITTIPTSGFATGIASVPGALYVADDVGGLVAIQIGNDLAITKTASAPVYVGQNLTYTLNVDNVGDLNATGVVVTDVLPTEVSFVSASPSCSVISGTVTCTLASALNAGATASFNIVVRPTAADIISNAASVGSDFFDVNSSNDSSSSTVTSLPYADLSIAKIAAPDPVYIGGHLTYTLTLANNGPSNATGVVVTDTLPAGVTLDTASPGCSGTTAIVCNVGGLNNGVTQTISIVVSVTPGANNLITNTAVATANEKDFTPATVTASTTVLSVADLSITKTDSPDPATISQPLTYTLTVNNLGPSTATQVVMTDVLSANVQFVSASIGGCTGTTTLRCNLGDLSKDAVITVTLTVKPIASGLTLSNSASVSSDVYDPHPENNVVGPVLTKVKYQIMLPLVIR